MLVFFRDFECTDRSFAPGRPPGYPKVGRPAAGISGPKTLLFGLLSRSTVSKLGALQKAGSEKSTFNVTIMYLGAFDFLQGSPVM